ncbi:alpha-N-acetylgalactosamine-specific lectin-like [Antedon mediterranea]|uniref:alpha-N-acetylgalactosamine-specific lectin-like n=1 Tax=Antedon mediterranea TaxID=105859 RepID=UPI003AF40D1F
MKMMLYIVFIAALIVPTLQATCGCPKYWVPYLNNCYRIFAEKVTWGTAESKCRNWAPHAHLVSIRNTDENHFVSRLWNTATHGLTTTDSVTSYWIGLTDSTHEGRFLWSDGNSLPTYTNWDSGEPNNYKGREDCVSVWDKNNSQEKWNDIPCSFRHGYVCKVSQ